MKEKITNRAIIKFLKSKFKTASFVDGLKIKYRSLICPFIPLLKMIEPGDQVADVGCGSGQFLLLASEFANPQSVYGVEISDKLIDNARTLFADMPKGFYHFEKFDGVTFPARLAEVDIIFLIDVLHHVPFVNQADFMRDLIRAMRPGTRLVLKDINASSPLVYCNKFHDMIFAGEMGYEMKMKEALALMEKYGLKILSKEKRRMYVYPHYCIVGQKK